MTTDTITIRSWVATPGVRCAARLHFSPDGAVRYDTTSDGRGGYDARPAARSDLLAAIRCQFERGCYSRAASPAYDRLRYRTLAGVRCEMLYRYGGQFDPAPYPDELLVPDGVTDGQLAEAVRELFGGRTGYVGPSGEFVPDDAPAGGLTMPRNPEREAEEDGRA